MEAELNIQKSVRGHTGEGPLPASTRSVPYPPLRQANRHRCQLHPGPHPPIPPPCQSAQGGRRPAGSRIRSLARYCVTDAEGNCIGDDEISTINSLSWAFLKELHLGTCQSKKAKTELGQPDATVWARPAWPASNSLASVLEIKRRKQQTQWLGLQVPEQSRLEELRDDWAT